MSTTTASPFYSLRQALPKNLWDYLILAVLLGFMLFFLMPVYVMVVTGLKTRSRYFMPWSLRTSRMLASVKTSAKGNPVLRAKRARTASRFVIELPSVSFKVVIVYLGSK